MIPSLLLWLLVQLLPLTLAAVNVPLSARYPQPARQFSVELMVAVQVGASSLLFPIIARGTARTIATVGSAGVMLLLAWFLTRLPYAADESIRVLHAWLWVGVWIAGLGQLLPVSPVPQNTEFSTGQAFVMAAVSLVTIGGSMLAYVASEYGSIDLMRWRDVLPIHAAMEVARSGRATWQHYLLPGVLILFAGAIRMSRRFISARQS